MIEFKDGKPLQECDNCITFRRIDAIFAVVHDGYFSPKRGPWLAGSGHATPSA